MVRRHISLLGLGSALLLTFLFTGSQAHADRVSFRFTGGHWSHERHAGWNRYWGGPSIGFYYSSRPVYIVDGYDDPYYYRDSEFWYSDPSFGLSIDIGGGGGYRRDYDRDRYVVRDRYYTERGHYYTDRDRFDRSSPRVERRSEFDGRDRDRSNYRIGDHSDYSGRVREDRGSESRYNRSNESRVGRSGSESHGSRDSSESRTGRSGGESRGSRDGGGRDSGGRR